MARIIRISRCHASHERKSFNINAAAVGRYPACHTCKQQWRWLVKYFKGQLLTRCRRGDPYPGCCSGICLPADHGRNCDRLTAPAAASSYVCCCKHHVLATSLLIRIQGAEDLIDLPIQLLLPLSSAHPPRTPIIIPLFAARFTANCRRTTTEQTAGRCNACRVLRCFAPRVAAAFTWCAKGIGAALWPHWGRYIVTGGDKYPTLFFCCHTIDAASTTARISHGRSPFVHHARHLYKSGCSFRFAFKSQFVRAGQNRSAYRRIEQYRDGWDIGISGRRAAVRTTKDANRSAT